MQPHLKLDEILHAIEHSVLKITLTILFLAWVCCHAWSDLESIVAHASEQKAKMIESSSCETTPLVEKSSKNSAASSPP